MRDQVQLRKNACEAAGSLLKDNTDYLDKIIKLWSIGNSLYEQCWDTEFHIFGVIESDTDHLPTKEIRKRCSEMMLEKSDKELKKIIESYKTEVENACNEILSKHKNI